NPQSLGDTRTPGAVDREFQILGVGLSLRSEDAGLPREFALLFGGDESAGPAERSLVVELATTSGQEDFGRLLVTGDDLPDPARFLLDFSSSTVPLGLLESSDPGSVLLGLGGSPEPMFVFRENVCLFRKVPRWRRIVSHFLFLRMLRMRSDALFFHAASAAISGRGALFIGPKGTGKSTTVLALAARGHGFLGDETACYLPASGEILPFRR